ncbi:hypothetical protein MTR67_039544 [Solanum verrucosum]|uniref:HECT-type E3 ubiquitin transferase n=1 Tax=Solanum verrucosum TaxID=315347 RepID=A0AAF0ZRA1_SOLVR|nr:hypothetical protein MTR67_039544 [Solanum verrucosum]
MAYQLPYETISKRRFNDYAAASTAIQFFVRVFSGRKSLVIQANSSDTVESVHGKIHSITGIRPIQSTSAVPAMEQRLIYRGKQLELCQTLLECGIQNDGTLQFFGRMRSTRHPYTWKLMSDLNLVNHDLCNWNDNTDINAHFARMTKMLNDFLAMTPKDGADGSEEYLQIFIHSSVPAALVKLYVYPSVTKKQAAHGCICQFIDSCKTLFTNPVTVYRLFAPILFEFCKILRGAAGVDDTLYIFCRSSLVEMMKWYVHNVKYELRLKDVFPFVHELATMLSHALELSVQSTKFIQLSESDVREFIKFMHPVKCAIRRQKAFGSPVSFPSLMQDEAGNEGSEINGVHSIFCDLVEKSELCLKKVESQLGLVNIERDYQWILEHKEVTNFKIRQRFALRMLREGRQKNEELYEMLICRSRLFEDSFQYIGHGSPSSLRGQLFIQFENEEATGPGVLREWFFLVCEAIFNPQNALFVSCPNDGRRFFPNPVFGSKVVDGCKKILEMDTKMVDEDILGLTFVCEDEQLGSRKVVELCPNGKNTIVNSENRDNYVNLLVKHHFVTSIAHQIVGSMSAEQRNVLLFFWTSIKSLPVEGFGGLDSKLHIYRTSDSHDCLPSSHTCFYFLCFPPYLSMDVMQNRLNIITQTYVGCSFGAE